jgi:SpoVK/Ycf46/Vps4 family AAA+-type ATPase
MSRYFRVQTTTEPKLGIKYLLIEIQHMHNYSIARLKEKDTEEAGKALNIAIHHLHTLIVNYQNHPDRNQWVRRNLKYIAYYMQIDSANITQLARKGQILDEAKQPNIQLPPMIQKGNKILQEAFDKFTQNFIPPTEIRETWDDVVGMEKVKNDVHNALLKQLQLPLFNNENAQTTGVLLYGPPGTGKSMVAKALGKKVSIPFINLGVEDIVSKYQGESEQNVAKFFLFANHIAPCIVFFGK